jgi:hypothetical protein
MSAFGGKADMTFCENPLSRSLLGVERTSLFAAQMSAYDPKRTPNRVPRYVRLALKMPNLCGFAHEGGDADSWHGRNHHNFNEHPRSPKVGREASPRRRVCRIDPLVPNKIMIFEQTHVSDPDLGA